MTEIVKKEKPVVSLAGKENRKKIGVESWAIILMVFGVVADFMIVFVANFVVDTLYDESNLFISLSPILIALCWLPLVLYMLRLLYNG